MEALTFFCNDCRVASLSKRYLTALRIVLHSMKSIEQIIFMPNFKEITATDVRNYLNYKEKLRF